MVSSVSVQLQLRGQVARVETVPYAHRLTVKAIQYVLVGRSMLYNMLTKKLQHAVYNMLYTFLVTVATF